MKNTQDIILSIDALISEIYERGCSEDKDAVALANLLIELYGYNSNSIGWFLEEHLIDKKFCGLKEDIENKVWWDCKFHEDNECGNSEYSWYY